MSDSKDTQATVSSPQRRNLLKRAAVTLPFIATIPSGAALARSSNMIGISSEPMTDAASGVTYWLCLDTSHVASVDTTSVDLGEPPYVNVTAITERDYHTQANGGSAAVSEATMCQNGGTYYYNSTGWKSVNVPQGALVSATALSSFSASLTMTDV